MIFNVVIFVSAMGYLGVTEDYLIALPAFTLVFTSENVGYSDDDVRFVAITASAILIIACLYRVLTDGLIPGLSDNGLPMALTWWLLILAVVKAHSTIK